MDRFKFRVWITVPITRDVEEEKEVSFYIYDIALYDDGGIGFSRDSLLDALDKLNLTEGQRNEIEDYISDNSYSGDWEWYVISFDTIEQCTGLKDKNGKLIYEGDIVREVSIDEDSAMGVEYEEVSVVCFGGGDYPYSFTLKHPRFYRGYALLNYGYMRQEIEVIGNIHENADLLGE